MDAAEILVHTLRGAVSMIGGIVERRSGKRLTAEQWRDAFLTLAADPPDKTEFEEGFDKRVAEMDTEPAPEDIEGS